jgi:hypothetical protein
MKIILFWMTALASSASACPLCHTETGDKIRAAVFGADFWFNVGVTVLPFAIFLSITAFIYFRVPRREPRVATSTRATAQ